MSELDPDKIRDRLEQVGNDWADKKSAYEALDDLTKTVLADITSEFLDISPSKAAAELTALGDAAYKTHLEAKATARREYLRAEVKWKTANTWAELRRSRESTMREEMRLK